MKKVLFGALMLVSALLVGCKKDSTSDSGNLTKFEIRPAQATLAEGAELALTVVKEPSTAKVSVTWTSSDENICTVTEEGVVHAIGIGEAVITAKEAGGMSAVSKIKVTSYIESFRFDQVCCYAYEIPEGAEVKDIDIDDDGTPDYHCQMADVDFMVFSEGFHVNESGHYDGAEEPIMLHLPCKMMVAPRDLNGGQGTIFCLGEWIVNADSADAGYTMSAYPGVYSEDYVDNMIDAFEAYNEGDGNGFYSSLSAAGDAVHKSGAYLEKWYYMCDEDDPTSCGYGVEYVPSAILANGLFDITSGRDGSSPYMIPLDYYEFDFRELLGSYWGMDVSYDNDSNLVVNSRNVSISAPIHMEMEGGRPASAGPRFVQIPVLTEEYPEIAKNFKKVARRPGTTQLMVK